MAVSSKEFVGEIQRMVRAKHSKDHPIIGMIEDGELDRDGLKGFVGQFYLFFPQTFSQTDRRNAEPLSRRSGAREDVDRERGGRGDGRNHRHRQP